MTLDGFKGFIADDVLDFAGVIIGNIRVNTQTHQKFPQQRVALIRCLCQPFSFLLLDEPVSHLDEQNNQIAASIIMEQARLQGASIIATSVGNNIKISTDSTLRL